jgi:DNA-binding transcriptional regulator YiaG
VLLDSKDLFVDEATLTGEMKRFLAAGSWRAISRNSREREAIVGVDQPSLAGRQSALRRHLGLTQRELSDRLGTRQQTISEWEKGMYRPRGASATLLSIVADRSGFTYKAGKKHDESKR